MIFFALYALAGVYLLLIAAGLIHRRFLESIDPFRRPSVRLALVIFGLGLSVSGMYYVYLYVGDFQRRQNPAPTLPAPNQEFEPQAGETSP